MKTLRFDIEKVKKAKGGKVIIEGWANRAMKQGQAVIDRGREHIPAGEWKISEWLENPIIFFNHDRDIPIGKGIPEKCKVKEDGLWIAAEISNSEAPDIKKARDLIEEEILRTFSVGIDVEDELQADDGTIVLKGVNLLETSVVSIPMNQESFFSISKKSLEETPYEKVAAEICNSKGAWVAGAIHNRIYEMQAAEGDEFKRADALQEVAEQANIPTSELFEILAGNTVGINEDVLNAFASVLGMVPDELMKLNEADIQASSQDASTRPTDEMEEEENEDENPEDLPPNQENEDEEEENNSEDGQDEDETPEKQQKCSDQDDGEKPKEDEEEGEADPDEEEIDEETKLANFIGAVKSGLEAGKDRSEAIAAALADYDGTPKAEDWSALFEAIDQKDDDTDKTKNENAEPPEIPSEENQSVNKPTTGETEPVDIVDQDDVDLGQPAIQAAQQTNVLLAQLLSEIRKLTAVMSNIKPSGQPAPMQPNMELGKEADKKRSLDIIAKYKQNIDERLKTFDV